MEQKLKTNSVTNLFLDPLKKFLSRVTTECGLLTIALIITQAYTCFILKEQNEGNKVLTEKITNFRLELKTKDYEIARLQDRIDFIYNNKFKDEQH